MADEYALQLELAGAGAGKDLLRTVAHDVVGWVNTRLPGADLTPEPGHTTKGRGHLITITADETGPAAYWRLVWEQPDAGGDPLIWRSEVRLATVGDGVEFGIQVRVVAEQGNVRPLRAAVGPPNLIPQLIESYSAKFGSQPVRATPTTLRADSVGPFVERELLSADRALPAVVVTTARDGRPLVDDEELAAKLAGLATVYTLSGDSTVDRFRRLVGERLSCYGGAVRIYWPGFNPDVDHPYRHPLWTPWKIDSLRRALYWSLLHRIAPIAARTYVEGRAWRESTEACDAARQSRIREQLLAAANNHDADALEQLLNEQADREREIADENRRLEDRVAELESELLDREDELDRVRENFRMVQDAEPDTEQESIKVTPTTVVDAVLLAGQQFDCVRFLSSAYDSAEDSPFNRPEKVYEAFGALEELAIERRERPSLGDSIEAWFRTRGFDYAPHISQTSRTKFEREYTFSYNGEDVLMDEHIKFGISGNPAHSLRIHMKWDAADQCWVVGHVGRHLDNTKTA